VRLVALTAADDRDDLGGLVRDRSDVEGAFLTDLPGEKHPLVCLKDRESGPFTLVP
jgi:hypothetical protein